MSHIAMTVERKAELLLNDPAALANQDCHTWQHLPRAEIDAIQFEALKQRFALLRNSVPVLYRLAEAEGVTHIEKLDDVVPLLFEHTVFKSYPPSLLERKQFAQINRWLGKLVTPDMAARIAAVDVSGCQSLDDWFETMDEAVPELRVSHTSGTSGTISFLPNSVREWEKACDVRKLYIWNQTGPDMPDPGLHTVYPYFRKGYLSHVRANAFFIRALLPDETHFHAAYPATLSTDVLHLGARLRAAHAKGTLDRLEISPELLANKKAFDTLQADMPAYLSAFFEAMATKLRGKRVYIGATWNLLHGMAQAGLARGLESVFHPESYISTTGGAKGVVQPEGWREDVLRFTGAQRLNETYAMSELVSGSNPRCEHGNFHFTHTVIPFVLDPETSRPLPRTGCVTGRAAFYDLGADVHWGGFITGDEVTVEWDKPCACGRPSRYLTGAIQRYSEKNGGDDKITCAATEGSHREAMDFLNSVE